MWQVESSGQKIDLFSLLITQALCWLLGKRKVSSSALNSGHRKVGVSFAIRAVCREKMLGNLVHDFQQGLGMGLKRSPQGGMTTPCPHLLTVRAAAEIQSSLVGAAKLFWVVLYVTPQTDQGTVRKKTWGRSKGVRMKKGIFTKQKLDEWVDGRKEGNWRSFFNLVLQQERKLAFIYLFFEQSV